MTIHFRFLVPAALLALVITEANFPRVYVGLLVLMVLDTVSGVLKGFVRREFSTRKFAEGLAHKGLIAIIVAGGHTLYLVSPYDAAIPIGTTLATAFCASELISIIRNAADGGVTMPRFVIYLLSRLEEVVKSDLPRQRGS